MLTPTPPAELAPYVRGLKLWQEMVGTYGGGQIPSYVHARCEILLVTNQWQEFEVQGTSGPNALKNLWELVTVQRSLAE